MKKTALIRFVIGLGILGFFAAGGGLFRSHPALPPALPESDAIPIVLAKLVDWKLPCADPTNIDAKEVTAVAAAMPAEFKALDGKRVTLNGYAFPFNDESGKLKGFLMTPDQGLCCSGTAPPVHGVVCVFPGPVTEVVMDLPIQVTGIFSAGVKLTTFDGTGGMLMPWRLTCEKISKLDVPLQTN